MMTKLIRDVISYTRDKHYIDIEIIGVCRLSISKSGFQIRVCTRNYIPHFSTKTYVMGTQKNRLNETVLLGTHNICCKL